MKIVDFFKKTSTVAVFIVASSCTAPLNEDVSAHRIDPKIAACLLSIGLNDTKNPGITEFDPENSLKKCIIEVINKKHKIHEELLVSLRDVGFVCSGTGEKCEMLSRQRMYGVGFWRPDYGVYREIDSVVIITHDSKNIKSMSIIETDRDYRGYTYGPFRTSDSVPDKKR